MANFKVVEIFESINGEGRRVGQLAIFIRLQTTLCKSLHIQVVQAYVYEKKSILSCLAIALPSLYLLRLIQ